MRTYAHLVGFATTFCLLANSFTASGQSEMTFGFGLVSSDPGTLGNEYTWNTYFNGFVECYVSTPFSNSGETVYLDVDGRYSSGGSASSGLAPELYFGYAQYLTKNFKVFSRTGFSQRKFGVSQSLSVFQYNLTDWNCSQEWTHRGNYLTETLGFSYELRNGLSVNYGVTYYLGLGGKTKLDYVYRNDAVPSQSSSGTLKLEGSNVPRLLDNSIAPTFGLSYRRGSLGVDVQWQTVRDVNVYEDGDYKSPLKLWSNNEAVMPYDYWDYYTVSSFIVSVYYSIFSLK